MLWVVSVPPWKIKHNHFMKNATNLGYSHFVHNWPSSLCFTQQTSVCELEKTLIKLRNRSHGSLNHYKRENALSIWRNFLKNREAERKDKAIPGQALKVPGRWRSQTWRQSAHEGGKFVSTTNRPPLPPIEYSCYRLSQLQGHCTARRNI